MASRAMGSKLQGDTLRVDVYHGDRDSFARSVDRAAFGYVRRVHPSDGPWRCVDAEYAHTTSATGECVSTVVFAR